MVTPPTGPASGPICIAPYTRIGYFLAFLHGPLRIMNTMLVYLRRLIALLTCVGMVLPTAALAQCECCANGCPAKVAQPATQDCSQTSDCCQATSCCKTASCCKSKCCSQAESCETVAGTILPECHTACQCCDGEPPVTPARSTSTEKVETQLDLLATVAQASFVPSAPDVSNLAVPGGTESLHSPVRLHALLGVWLN